MSKYLSTTELHKMSVEDLHTEIRSSRNLIAKLRLGVTLQKEKNTAKYDNEKKQLARMLTVLSQKKKAETTLSSSEKQVSSSGQK